MTPGERDPRPSGFGVMSWCWWPVIFAGWGLAAAVMAGEALLGCNSAPPVPATAPVRPRTFHHRSRPFLALLAALASLSALSACAGSTGDPARTTSGPPFEWPRDYLEQARAACVGDGAPPAPGASTSGGDLASCQEIVAGRYGRGVPR